MNSSDANHMSGKTAGSVTIEDTQQQVIEEFESFDEWMERYSYLIDMGKVLPAMPEEYKTDDHLIKGCQSRVWVRHWHEGDRMYFEADSDAAITKGIIALLVRILSGRRAEEIAKADLHFIDDIGLKENLSPTRANGLVSMIQQMKAAAAQSA